MTGMLDFVVIGAGRSATTTLWHHLRSHPELSVPACQEAPFFADERLYARGQEWYLRTYFADTSPTQRRGAVSPQYMADQPGVPLPRTVDRLHRAAPDAQLVAILRDPIARAQSQHRLAVLQGRERRRFDVAMRELLEPAMLDRARREAPVVSAYVVDGEYGRILGCYLERFPREQLHVQLTGDLERDPAGTLRSVFTFLGVDDRHRLPEPAVRHHRGGRRRRVDGAAEAALKDYLEREAWPPTPSARERSRAFALWFSQWNVVPDDALPPIDAELRARLAEHFARDAAELERLLALSVPWRDAGTVPAAAGDRRRAVRGRIVPVGTAAAIHWLDSAN
jgi:hypothetical protein